MASSLGKNIVSHSSATGIGNKSDPEHAIEELKQVLSDQKQNFSRSRINQVVKKLVLLSKDDGCSRGKHHNNDARAQLRDFLQLYSTQDDFYDSLFSFFISAIDEDTAAKRQICFALKHKLLVAKLMKNWSPHVTLQAIYNHLESNLNNKEHAKLLLGFLFENCTKKEHWNTSSLRVLQLVNNPSISSSLHRCCLSLICSFDDNCYLFEAIDSDTESFEACTRKICKWLIRTTAHQSQQMSKLMAKKLHIVRELDGSPSRDFFTALNITHVYNSDQLNNIHAFSMLRQWLLVMQQYNADTWNMVMKNITRQTRAASAMSRVTGANSFYLASSSSESSEVVSLSSSMSSLHSFLYVEKDGERTDSFENSLTGGSLKSEAPPSHHGSKISLYSEDFPPRPMSVSTPKQKESHERHRDSTSSLPSFASTGGLSLKNASVKYCLRILSQAEKAPARINDKEIILASVLEAVRTLTLLCLQDESLVNKVFPEIKRVNARILGNSKEARRFFPADIQFIVEHYESMMYNCKELVENYFQIVPSQLYTSSLASFEFVDFCLHNMAFFERHPSFLNKFFPNLFKIVAWHPTTFLQEFLRLMPILVNESTAVELFHVIIDIPCTAAMLELSQQNNLDRYLEQNLQIASDNSASFLSKAHRTISDFFTRCESGGAETIDKLDQVYTALEPLSSRTRVQVSTQIVPLLLRRYFQCVSVLKSKTITELLIPSVLERLFVLHLSPSFQHEIRSLLSKEIVRLCSASPAVVSRQQEEFLSCLKKIRKAGPGMDLVITSMIYCIGEFTIRNGVSTVEQIAKYYELVETLLYETKISLFSVDDFPISAKVISSLISAAGKLAAYSQDFVPKTILSLTKLASQPWKANKCRLNEREFEIVTSRAIDVINLLRLPDVSPAVLCSGSNVQPWNADKNLSLQLKVHAIARKNKNIVTQEKTTTAQENSKSVS